MRVLLADDHPKVRWALRAFIEEDPELMVVGEASTVDTLLAQARALRPDLILLEWDLSGGQGASLIAMLHSATVGTRVVVLSQCPEIEPHALADGADAFVSKLGGPKQLATALRGSLRSSDS